MAKPLGNASVYVIGQDGGPVKIGITTRKPKERFHAAQRAEPSLSLRLFSTTIHAEAWLVEKFVHIYLRRYHRRGEWFNVRPTCAVTAVRWTIRMLEQERVRPVINPTWFQRVGITPEIEAEYFAREPTL